MILREIKNIYIKNRLTEGVDFKRYEWLKGDGRAYIDTGITDLSVSEYIKFEMDDSNDPAVRCMGCERNTQEGCGRLCFGWQGDSSSGGGTIYMWSDTGTWGANNNRRKWTLDLINNAAYTGSLSKTTGLVFPQKVQSFVLFGSRDSSGNVNIRSQCTMWSFEVHNQINLIPCQLIHAIPATLDANNIARQAGECGMYDSISGKFYGNVANTGTFTVGGEVEPENHSGLQQIYQNKLIEGVDYERYDWLKGDGSAYIKGIKYNLWTNRVEMKIGKINVTTIENNEIVYTKSPGNNWAVQQNPTLTTQLLCIFRESGVGVHILEVYSMPSQVTLSFYQNGGYAYCLYNGTEYKGNVLKQSSWDTDIIPIIHSYKMSYIREVLPDGSYHSNLIPCKLLRAITRNLDAQCKERVAGDCGMIDLISGKFYGNVANSGTFIIENDNNE